MPYFVFSIRPLAQIHKLAQFNAFRDASAHAKALRAAAPRDGARIKVIFADNEQLAEDLLCQIRDPRPSGNDD
jgi:hypothetical protein